MSRFIERKSSGRYYLTLLFFALGLMSKPMLVTLPFVLLLLDFWPLGRLRLMTDKDSVGSGENISSLIREKIPFLALALVSSSVTFAGQNSVGVVQSLDLYPLGARATNALVSYLEYLQKMVWPKNLTVFYPHPGTALPIWKGAVCAIALVCVSVVVVKAIKKAPYLAFGWFWYLGTLVPVIGVVQVGWQAMADRFAYIPLIGIFIAVAWGLPDLLAKRRWRNKALAVSAGIIISALMATAWTQVGIWKNSVTLFRHTIEATDKKYPSFSRAHLSLAVSFESQNKVDEAIDQYKKAIRLLPEYPKQHFMLANALSRNGNYKEAVAHYKEAIKQKPNYAKAYNNLGNALSAQGQYQAAIFRYHQAILFKRDYIKAYHNLGNALLDKGRFQEAIVRFRQALRIDQTYAEAHYSLGLALSRFGKPEEAIAHYKEAIKLRPTNANAHNNLGNILIKQGNIKGAILHYEQAIKIDPGFVRARKNFGLARSLAGKP